MDDDDNNDDDATKPATRTTPELRHKEPSRLMLFQQFKRECLNKTDLSRKGSIDEPIRQLVEIINQSPHYYTTSTCSGRVTLTAKPLGRSGIKKGNEFHLNSHEQVQLEQLCRVISCFTGEKAANDDDEADDGKCLWLKFEPFIMHVQCCDLEAAKTLLNIALASGCRNSGITLGKPNKFLLAVRSTSGMEIPLYCRSSKHSNFGALQEDYIKFLCDETNRRLSDNESRLKKFQEAVATGLSRGC